jgi:hypothetical protein
MKSLNQKNEIGNARAARVSIGSIGLFVVLLALLHVIKPEFDPSWHFISEYEIGTHGWIMQLAFLSLAVGNIALYISIRQHLRGWSGWVAAVMFLVGALGTVLGGIFVTDSLNTSAEAITTRGMLHNLGGALSIFGFIGTLMMSWKLFRNDTWRLVRQALALASGIVIVGFLVSFISIAALTTQYGGKFGPDVLVGWPNRFGVLAGCTWLLIVAWQVIKMQSKES